MHDMTDTKPTVTVRVSDEGKAWVKEAARLRQTSETVVLRALFSVGTRHPAEVDQKIEEFKLQEVTAQ